MINTEQAIDEILKLAPELHDSRTNDIHVLIGLGFEPLARRSGCGVFYEWYKEVNFGIIPWKLTVILEKQCVCAYAYNTATGTKYSCVDCQDVSTALQIVISKCKGIF